MDHYGKGLLLAAVMLGTVALSAVLVAGPRGQAAAAEEAVQTAAQGDAPTAGGSALALAEAALQQMGDIRATEGIVTAQAPVGAAVREGADEPELSALTAVADGTDTEPGSALPAAATEAQTPSYYVSVSMQSGQTVLLLDSAGHTLQQATADANGYAVFEPIPPGRYAIRQGTLGGEFRLLENAAVEALGGTLWSDGELLHLAQTETVRLLVECRVEAAQRGKVVTLSLTDKTGVSCDRSFVAGQAQSYEVAFLGLTPGQYELRLNGRLLRTLTLTGEPEQHLRLPED